MIWSEDDDGVCVYMCFLLLIFLCFFEGVLIGIST